MLRALSRIVAPAVALLVVLGAVATASIERGATATEVAARDLPEVTDIAVAFDGGEIDEFTVDAVARAVTSVGGSSATSRSASVGLIRVVRDGATVHAPPSGYLIPMGVLSFPEWAVAGIVGVDVAVVLDHDTVAMNQLTADTTGAQVGDTIELRAANGATVALRIGSIEPYEQIGFAEFVFTTTVAERLGVTDDTRVVMWGFDDRAALDQALIAEGVSGRANTKVNRSWDPPDPDDGISTPRIKALVGEPWYRINSDGSLSMHPTWKTDSLTAGRELLNQSIPIRAQCNVHVVDDLRAALAEVAAEGLGAGIDVANTNLYGGCYNPRYSRTSGYLSRHAYAVAIDMNTVTNCLGCVPQMDCRIVRIFRKHGFVWGGNWRLADGMHFEWIGQRRDQIAYPSRYCPNIVGPDSDFGTRGADVLTAGDPLRIHAHDHDEHGSHDHDGHGSHGHDGHGSHDH